MNKGIRIPNKPVIGKRGFTLIELMITLAIIGILAAVGTVSYLGQLHQIRAREGARQVWSDMHLARSNASKMKVDTVVLYYPTDSSYTMFIDTGSNLGKTGTPDFSAGKDRPLYTNPETGSHKKTLPGSVIIFPKGKDGLPTAGKDGEDIGDGVVFPNDRAFFQHTGRVTEDNDDNPANLLDSGKRGVYVVGINRDGKADADALYGVLVQPISGLPKIYKYNPSNGDWEE